MTKSAGILVYRRSGEDVEVLLVHPGGPFWAKKDEHAWSVPKGEFTAEDPESAAVREFEEELGSPPPEGPRRFLGEFRQSSSKSVWVWAVEGDVDETAIQSNTFETEWPPRSGEMREFPEVDRAAWWDVDTARTKLHKGQVLLLDALLAALSS